MLARYHFVQLFVLSPATRTMPRRSASNANSNRRFPPLGRSSFMFACREPFHSGPRATQRPPHAEPPSTTPHHHMPRKTYSARRGPVACPRRSLQAAIRHSLRLLRRRLRGASNRLAGRPVETQCNGSPDRLLQPTDYASARSGRPRRSRTSRPVSRRCRCGIRYSSNPHGQ